MHDELFSDVRAKVVDCEAFLHIFSSFVWKTRGKDLAGRFFVS
jgi:hypothetical protein